MSRQHHIYVSFPTLLWASTESPHQLGKSQLHSQEQDALHIPLHFIRNRTSKPRWSTYQHWY